MAKIIGPGSLNVDVTGYAPHLPVDGETVKGTAIRVSPGGKGNNQMTAAHRAGSEVYIIGYRGSDMMGQIMEMISACSGDDWNKPLDGTYLMGYYLQRAALYAKKTDNEMEETENG